MLSRWAVNVGFHRAMAFSSERLLLRKLAVVDGVPQRATTHRPVCQPRPPASLGTRTIDLIATLACLPRLPFPPCSQHRKPSLRVLKPRSVASKKPVRMNSGQLDETQNGMRGDGAPGFVVVQRPKGNS